MEIGTVPNSEIFKNFVKMNTAGEIVVNRKTMATGCSGIFAAGDICGPPFQMAKAVGEGCVAAITATNYLKRTGDINVDR